MRLIATVLAVGLLSACTQGYYVKHRSPISVNKRINYCGRRVPEELRTAWFNGFDAGSNGVQIDIEGYDEDAILTYDYDDDDRYSEDEEE